MQLKAEPSKAELSISDYLDETGKVVYTYHMGPYDISSMTSANAMILKPATMRFNLEEPLWVTSIEPIIEDAEGAALPNELVHQILLVNHGEENSFCTTSQTGNPFAATSSNMEKIELPEGHGYAVVPSDPLEARVVLQNPLKQDFFGVYIKVILVGEPMDNTKMMTDVLPMMIDLDPCYHEPINIAPGQFVEKVEVAYSPETGSVIQAHGLLQNYGVSVSLTKGDEGDPFWKGTALIDDDHRITSLPPFQDPAGVAVGSGDMITLTVAYNNASDDWFDSAIGAAMVYLARTEAENEGGAPKSAISTQKDLF